MLKELQEFGLSENEARVYLASLEIGKATAEQVARHAGVKRPTTYVQLESLMQRGLMSSFDERKKTYFAAESPEYLKRVISAKKLETEYKEKELEKLLPELKDLFEHAGVRPRVRFFEGKEGIITMREEFLKAKEKEMFAIFSQDALLEIFSKTELDEYSQKRLAFGIKTHAVYTRKAGKFKEELPPHAENWRFMPEEKLSLGADILVYDKNVALMAHRGKIMGVIVENEEIAKSMRSLFHVVWETAGQYNK